MIKQNTAVLLVEDHAIAQKIAILALEPFQCQVDIAANGTQALEMYNNNQYDLILMDLGLPDIDGVTVTETIRRQGSDQIRVPIVALTANADETYRNHCIEAGMDDFLLKPISTALCKKVFQKVFGEQILDCLQ